MSMKMGTKIGGLILAAAVATLSFAPAAEATPISYDFTVSVTSGPLAGTVENGSFAYDSGSIIPGAHNIATGLTALDFTFNGTTYDAVTANTGELDFDAAGNLDNFAFGNNCFSGGCSVSGYTDAFSVQPGYFGFAYIIPTSNDFGFGSVTFALASVPVPEPGALGLFGIGVLLIGAFVGQRGRRRAG